MLRFSDNRCDVCCAVKFRFFFGPETVRSPPRDPAHISVAGLSAFYIGFYSTILTSETQTWQCLAKGQSVICAAKTKKYQRACVCVFGE